MGFVYPTQDALVSYALSIFYKYTTEFASIVQLIWFHRNTRNRLVSQIWGVSAATGACFCFLYARPSTRSYLDRVSFRIMVYALGCNLLHGIATAVCAFQTSDSAACGSSVWLIIVHGVNGHMMEKYYILGALTIALGVTIPPLASKQYGWDNLNEACWMTASDQDVRLRWQLGSQLVWSLFAALGEAIVFLIVVVYMFRHQASQINGSRTRSDSVTLQGTTPADAKTKAISHAAQYRGVIIRIAFYPAVSIVLNGITVACDLYFILNNLVYGLRPSIYALLAISDPALMRALRSLLNEYRGKKENTTGMSSSGGPVFISHATLASQGQITIHIELEEVRQTDEGETLPPLDKESTAKLRLDKADEGLASRGDLPDRLSVLHRGQLRRAKEAKAAAAAAKEDGKTLRRRYKIV
ncbi:hypothetical protein C8R43DRAFT_1137833 [Mycena crocata]|nr:hypothetical protein C8R43DRAFT_1137833 [Mycena crocata]